MLRWILFIMGLALMLSSCARNLLTDIRLRIDDTNMNFHIGSGRGEEEYFYPDDSDLVRQGVLSDLRDYFNKKGNDVTVVNHGGEYSLQITSCTFYEFFSTSRVIDPCDSIAPYDTLTFEVHQLRVTMECMVKDSSGQEAKIVEAESSDEERVKDHPTFLQSLLGHETCYCPRVHHILFVDKLQRRVVRRIHRQCLEIVKTWQQMKMG